MLNPATINPLSLFSVSNSGAIAFTFGRYSMTVEHWTDDRLDQLADDVDNLRVSVADLRTTAEIMLQTQLQHQRNFEVVVTEIRDIRTDIQGLQLENRRMLEELRDRRDNEDI